MRRNLLVFAIAAMACVLLWAQQERPFLHRPFEMKSVFPPEVSPGEFRQVDQLELQRLAEQGWELVGVVPFVYRNEERGDPKTLRPIVTQTYPAYFFKRPKIMPK
jgi:hypothetical protein